MVLEHEKVIEFRELKKELFKEKMRRNARATRSGEMTRNAAANDI